MAEPVKPAIQKPPGYRDPNAPALQKPPGYRDPNSSVKPAARPPVRKPVLPSSFHPKKKRRSCCRLCCCFLCILLLILIVLVLLLGGLFFLWFNPKFPVFHLQSFKIERFHVTVKSDGTHLDSQTAFSVEAKNPNGKLTLHYGRAQVKVTVGDDDTELGSASLGGFTQREGNRTSLKFSTQVKDALVDDGVGTKLKARFRSKALAVFVEVRTRVGLGVARWKTGMVGVNVLCGDASLKELDAGAMPKCTINLFKWINIH